MSAIPKLRFPEFDGEWKQVSSGDFYDFRNGLNFTKGMSGEEIKILGVSDFQSNNYFTDFEKLPSVRVAGKVSSKDTLADDDLVFVRSNGNKDLIGRCMFLRDVDRKVSFSGFIIRGRISQNGLDALFGALLFKSSKFRTYLSIMGGGTNISNLSQTILSDFTFLTPTLCEQQKIASFLSSVDKKIDLLRQKKDALELYKKGLMQKIFSQEIRFKQDDRSDFPDWEEVALGDVFTERSERGHGDKQLLGVTLSKGVVPASEIEKIDRSSSDLSNYKYVKIGDIAYNSMRMWQGASGASSYNGIVSPAYTVITPLGDNETRFWAYLFKYPEMIKVFERHSQGLTSDTWNLKFKALSTIKVLRPSGEEQKKISAFFNSIDAKLEKFSSQIAQMENFKKGLLQQMFV